MLDTVTRGFRNARNRFANHAVLTPELIDESLGDIRISLLEADVSLEVVNKFVARLRESSVGELVKTTAIGKDGKRIKVTPQEHFLKLCHDGLETLLGPASTGLAYAGKGQLTLVMMVGLQGSGKTTTSGKLAARLQGQGKKVMLVAADTYRPAAVEQLQSLGSKLGIPVFFEPGQTPPQIVDAAVKRARTQKFDVAIIDTAGRLAIDAVLMAELETIRTQVHPHNILLVTDAMTGQDAVRTAAEFDRALALDGFILTKLDGDARGGAALSIRSVTGKPVKFLGMGEGLDKLEEFRPDGLASRILGFGDVVGLMKDFESVVDEEKAEADAAKLLSGRFDMRDFVEQIRTVRKVGPLRDVLEKMPFFGEMTAQLNPDERELDKIDALFNSMTEAERKTPHIISKARTERIARGAGRKPGEVQELLAKFNNMKQMMGALGSDPGLLGRLPFFKQLGQLSRLKDLQMGTLLGKDPMLAQAMTGEKSIPVPQMSKGYTPALNQSMLSRARLQGYDVGASTPELNEGDRKAIRERRKREKLNKKKNRRR